MTSTNFEKNLNLLIGAIKNGMPKERAEEQLERVIKYYAIFPREETIARERYAEAMKARDENAPVQCEQSS